MTISDPIDPKAGILLHKKIGDRVEKGISLATLYADDEMKLHEVLRRVEKAFTISETPVKQTPLIKAMIDEQGVHPWKSV